MSAPVVDLYADFTVKKACELIDERIAAERAVLARARAAVTEAYRKLRIADLVEGNLGPGYRSPTELRHEAQAIGRVVGELQQMRLALATIDPAAGLRKFAADTPHQLLAADASAMAIALLRSH